jgi:hypothetical protein
MTASELLNPACRPDALRLIRRRAGHSRAPGRPAQSRHARQFRSRHGLRRQSVAATAPSHARVAREPLQTVARTKAAWHPASRRAALLYPRPDRGCVADQPQHLRRNDRIANTQPGLQARRAAADPAPRRTQPRSGTPRAITTRPAIPFASWTAPAKRSGDGAFARTRGPRTFANRRPHESRVAPRFPPSCIAIPAPGPRLCRRPAAAPSQE